MLSRTLLVVVVLLAASASFAQTGWTPPGAGYTPPPGARAVGNAARQLEPWEILSITQGNSVQKAVSWGSRLATGANVLMVSGLISAALFEFYEWFGDQATGTSLDDWWNGATTGAAAIRVEPYWEGDTRISIYRPNGSSVTSFVRYGWEYSHGSAVGWGESAYQERAEQYGLPGGYGSWEQFRTDYDSSYPEAYHYGMVTYYTTGDRPPLDEWLEANPDALSAVQNQVLPEYVEREMVDPFTYADPFGDGTVTVTQDDGSPIEMNEWHDNPYLDPTGDADGDGYMDWEEHEASSDPQDAGSIPDVTPNPNRDTDGDGWPDQLERERGTDPTDVTDYPDGSPETRPDVDLDGIPDALDPCPYVAHNNCTAADPVPELEIPTDYARENTAAATLTEQTNTRSAIEEQTDVLEEVRDSLDVDIDGDAGTWTDPAPATFASPDLTPLETWSPDLAPARSALESSVEGVETQFAEVMAAAEGTFPFGMGSILAVPETATIGSECATVTVSVMGNEGAYDMCSSPLDGFLTGTVRPLLVVLLTFGCLWLLMEWMRGA